MADTTQQFLQLLNALRGTNGMNSSGAMGGVPGGGMRKQLSPQDLAFLAQQAQLAQQPRTLDTRMDPRLLGTGMANQAAQSMTDRERQIAAMARELGI